MRKRLPFLFVCFLITFSNYCQNSFPLYSGGAYGSGSLPDGTDVTTPQLKLLATSGYIRVPHLSASSFVSAVYNFETGKNVYWGEPTDAGSYYFRGRDLFITEGKLGIGTNSPAAKLHLKSGALMTSDPSYDNINARLDGTSIPSLRFTRYIGSPDVQHNAFVGQFQNASLSYEYSFAIGVGSSTSGNQNTVNNALVIPLNGNVGVGTNAPTEKLTVMGNVYVPLSSSFGHLQSTDKFAHAGYEVGNYSLGWYNDPWTNGAPSGFLSAFGGLKIFTGGNPRFAITNQGDVGIGTTTPDAKLAVKGTIHAEEVKVDLSVPWPDFVFGPNYKLQSLESIADYIKSNKHLPDVPSAKEVEENGVNLGEINKILLQKIEELTLYSIEFKKIVEEQNLKIKSLQNDIESLKKLMK